MGVKKATKTFSTKSLKKTTLAKLRQDIIKEKGADSDYKVIVAVDVSIHMRQSLANKRQNSKVQGQYHAYPRVPVTAVSKAVQSKIAILIRNNYFPILVADGVHHPLKQVSMLKGRTRKM